MPWPQLQNVRSKWFVVDYGQKPQGSGFKSRKAAEDALEIREAKQAYGRGYERMTQRQRDLLGLRPPEGYEEGGV